MYFKPIKKIIWLLCRFYGPGTRNFTAVIFKNYNSIQNAGLEVTLSADKSITTYQRPTHIDEAIPLEVVFNYVKLVRFHGCLCCSSDES